MAWLASGAWVAFVLGSALVSGPVDAEVAAGPATSNCLLAMNLARTARLDVRLSVLKEDNGQQGLVVAAITDNTLAGADENNCTVADNVTPVSDHVVGFMHVYQHDGKLDCPAFVQDTLTKALGELANYDAQPWDNGVAAPYQSKNVQNLVYLMFATATGLGCGVTTNCAGGTNLLICRFTPSITNRDNTPPFTADFFKALKARAAKGINLSSLTANDIDTPLDKPGGGGGGSGSGGRVGVPPGAIPAALLIITSLLGFVSFH